MEVPRFSNHIATNFFLWAMLITAFVMAVYSYAVFHDRILPALPSDSKKHFLVANNSEAEWTGKIKLSSDGKTLEHTVPIHINTPATNRMANARGVSNAALGSLSSTLEYYTSENLADNSGVQWRGLTTAGAGGEVLSPVDQYVNVIAFKSKKDQYAQVHLSGHVRFSVLTTDRVLNLCNIPLPAVSRTRGSLQILDWSMDDHSTQAIPGTSYQCEISGGTLSFLGTYIATAASTENVSKHILWDLDNTHRGSTPIEGVEFWFNITYQTDPDAVAVSTTVHM